MREVSLFIYFSRRGTTNSDKVINVRFFCHHTGENHFIRYIVKGSLMIAGVKLLKKRLLDKVGVLLNTGYHSDFEVYKTKEYMPLEQARDVWDVLDGYDLRGSLSE